MLATPAYISGGLLAPLHDELAQRLNAIRYVATALVVMAFDPVRFRVSVPYDGFGFLAPRSEDTTLVACTWAALKFPHRAPEGGAVIRAFVGGDGREANALLPDEELIRGVRSDLSAIMGLDAEPLHCHVHRWPRGNPQYDVGHGERVEEIDALARSIPGLHLAGSAYRGIGVPDCIHDGMRTAEALLASPRAGKPPDPTNIVNM